MPKKRDNFVAIPVKIFPAQEPAFTFAEMREAFVSGWRSGAAYARAGKKGEEAQAYWIEYCRSLEQKQ